MSQTHRGAEQPPRILFLDAPPEAISAVEGVGGGYDQFATAAADDFHAFDFDLIVTFPTSPLHSDDLTDTHVLAFGVESVSGRVKTEMITGLSAPATVWVGRDDTHSSRQIRTATSAPGPWHEFSGDLEFNTALKTLSEQLLVRSIIDRLPDSNTREVWSDLPHDCAPLILVGPDGSHAPLAFLQVNGPDDARRLRLVLPAETTDYAAWLAAFLRLVRMVDPSSVPAGPDWRHEMAWAPPSLRRSLAAMEDIEQERERVLADLDKREAALTAEVSKALIAAQRGEHRLLTADGDELVEAVKGAFETLGFTVRDMDAELGPGEPRLEDLQIRDADDPDWEALVEVKGYTKGAKANDVTQLTSRPAVQFAAQQGRAPRSLWFVANAWRDTHPASREQPLQSDPATVNTLEQSHGAVLDTRDLLRALQQVDSSAIETVRWIRQSLRAATGRWHPPTAP